MSIENKKYEVAQRKLATQPTQPVTPIGKGERLEDAVRFMTYLQPSLQEVNRQKLFYVQKVKVAAKPETSTTTEVIRIKDVMPLLTNQRFGANWGVVPINQLVEWASQEGYLSFQEIKQDFTILPIGGGDCTVEIACDPARTDLIRAFQKGGVAGLQNRLQETNEKIATDTVGIATYFFGTQLLETFSGSLEALPKWFAPVIVGIVQSGNSLDEENWYRLAKDFKNAVLLRSQLAVVIRKEKN